MEWAVAVHTNGSGFWLCSASVDAKTCEPSFLLTK